MVSEGMAFGAKMLLIVLKKCFSALAQVVDEIIIGTLKSKQTF